MEVLVFVASSRNLLDASGDTDGLARQFAAQTSRN